jgi:hypothetical protein
LRVTGQACEEQGRLTGRDTQPGDYFGKSVSISGNTVVSVAPYEDGVGEDAGAAYVFTGADGVWTQQAKLVGNDTLKKQNFGRSVSIAGDSVVIGSESYEGAAYVFKRFTTSWGGDHYVWTEQAKLQAKDKRGGDEFGKSVGIAGGIIAVGAPNGNAEVNYAGAAYIFKLEGSAWVQETKFWASDTKRGDYFGSSIAISDATVAVGTSPTSEGATPGAIYIFTWSSGLQWTQQAKIYRSGASGGDDFGTCIALHQDTLLIGAPGDDEVLTDSGAVYVFVRDGSTWSQQAKLAASDRMEHGKFGSSVSISGYLMAVLATGVQDQDSNFGGSVYVFAQRGSDWIQQSKAGGSDTVFGDRFGFSVSISGNYLAAGAPRKAVSGASSGAAYFLKCVTTTTTTTTLRDLSQWLQGQYVGGNVDEGSSSSPTLGEVTSFSSKKPLVLSLLTAFFAPVLGH